MNALYVDTSALLAWLLGQKRGPAVRAAIDSAHTAVTSILKRVFPNYEELAKTWFKSKRLQ